MAHWNGKIDVLLVGGGMISKEVLLPTIFQERKRGLVGRVLVSSLTARIITEIRELFPDEEFEAYPDPKKCGLDEKKPELFKEAIKALGEHGCVVVAVPDHLHTMVILEALAQGRDCVVEKPLCLKVADAHEIWKRADEKALYVYTDFHKRHDRAIRAARYRFRKGDLGEMLHGHAWIEEKKLIPLEVFKDWCMKSSPFEYIGVHYVDAYHFITGLKPRRLVAFGQQKFLRPYYKDAFDAIQATIQWEDDSVLFIQTSWVCSNKNSALTNQGLMLHGTMGEYWADHKDRNLHFVTEANGFEHYNPNFFKVYNDWDDPSQPDYVGYGYDSLVQGIRDVRDILLATEGMDAPQTKKKREEIITRLKEVRPLPNQAIIGTAVNDAVRVSIANNSAWVGFDERLYPKLL